MIGLKKNCSYFKGVLNSYENSQSSGKTAIESIYQKYPDSQGLRYPPVCLSVHPLQQAIQNSRELFVLMNLKTTTVYGAPNLTGGIAISSWCPLFLPPIPLIASSNQLFTKSLQTSFIQRCLFNTRNPIQYIYCSFSKYTFPMPHLRNP